MFNRQDLDYLLADLQEYGKTRFEQAKLTLLDKLSRIAALLLLGLAVILIVFAIVAIGGVALISALSNCMPTWAAALIVAAIWLVFLVLVIALRKHLFLNPMLAAIAAILTVFTGQHWSLVPLAVFTSYIVISLVFLAVKRPESTGRLQ